MTVSGGPSSRMRGWTCHCLRVRCGPQRQLQLPLFLSALSLLASCPRAPLKRFIGLMRIRLVHGARGRAGRPTVCAYAAHATDIHAPARPFVPRHIVLGHCSSSNVESRTGKGEERERPWPLRPAGVPAVGGKRGGDCTWRRARVTASAVRGRRKAAWPSVLTPTHPRARRRPPGRVPPRIRTRTMWTVGGPRCAVAATHRERYIRGCDMLNSLAPPTPHLFLLDRNRSTHSAGLICSLLSLLLHPCIPSLPLSHLPTTVAQHACHRSPHHRPLHPRTRHHISYGTDAGRRERPLHVFAPIDGRAGRANGGVQATEPGGCRWRCCPSCRWCCRTGRRGQGSEHGRNRLDDPPSVDEHVACGHRMLYRSADPAMSMQQLFALP